MRKISLLALVCMAMLFWNCRETKEEKMKEKIESVGDELEEGAEDVGDALEDGAEEVEEEVEDAVDDN